MCVCVRRGWLREWKVNCLEENRNDGKTRRIEFIFIIIYFDLKNRIKKLETKCTVYVQASAYDEIYI